MATIYIYSLTLFTAHHNTVCVIQSTGAVFKCCISGSLLVSVHCTAQISGESFSEFGKLNVIRQYVTQPNFC